MTLVEKTFRSVDESKPAEKWAELFKQRWSDYKKWFLVQGDAARPLYGECVKQLKQHMPELLPTYRLLTDLAGGSDSAARFLSMYCPPPYFSGCTQAVWGGEEPVLIRNYDYKPDLLDGSVLRTNWNGQTVIAMSDASWGVLDGINESGLAVSLAFGGRVEVGKGFGVPIILRYILEFCEDTPSAIEVLKRVPTHMSYNITVLDKQKRFATVYITPDKTPVVRQVPVATNHQGKVDWPRHAWATATLERESAVLSVISNPQETIEGLVSCFMHPPVYNAAFHRGSGTLYTAIYRPLSGTVSYLWPQHAWNYGIDYFTEECYDINFGNSETKI